MALCRIPSVSATGFPPEEVRRSAQAMAQALRDAGVENVEVLPQAVICVMPSASDRAHHRVGEPHPPAGAGGRDRGPAHGTRARRISGLILLRPNLSFDELREEGE